MSKRIGNGKKTSFTTLAIEVVSIVLGVMLALAANEWRENRQIERLKATSLQSIRQEIETNLALLSKAHEHHTATLAMLREALENEAEMTPEKAEVVVGRLHKRGGIYQMPSVLDTAWESAKTAQVLSYFDYEQLLVLANVYKVQRSYNEFTRSIIQTINLVHFMDTDAVRYLNGTQGSLNEVWYSDRRLMNAYEEALEALAE